MTFYDPRVKPINKILIANRGEIATRIISTASKMGIETVEIITSKQGSSLATYTAEIETDNPVDFFLNGNAIIEIAKKFNVDAIHPGYGFLSENAEFARLVEEEGIIFIGPSHSSIKLMGNKSGARNIAEDLMVPVTKALKGSIDEILTKGSELKFPVLVKADAGGGGKGMLLANKYDELEEKLLQASREAKNYFGCGNVYVEEYITGARHIEVQILGDKYGNLIHLFERECSVQRRYQKIIEECPSPAVNDSLRKKITGDALKICHAIGYYNAGTIEFLVDENHNHFFLEMNTRIQVEHPVTEMVTGIDIVKEQILISMGFALAVNQKNVKITGHSIECRIYAEDAEKNFNPSPGKIHRVKWPGPDLVRTDTWFYGPVEITPEYDPMLAKIVCHGINRNQAVSKMSAALNTTSLMGIETNINYLKSILSDPDFKKGFTNTDYCKTHEFPHVNIPSIQTIAASYFAWLLNYKPKGNSVWHKIGFFRLINETTLTIENNQVIINWQKIGTGKTYCLIINGTNHMIISDIEFTNDHLSFSENNRQFSFYWVINDMGQLILEFKNKPITISHGYLKTLNEKGIPEKGPQFKNEILHAPIPGKITGIKVNEGAFVKKGDCLITLEAMKMENHIIAIEDGIVEKILPVTGQQVKANEILIIMNPIPTKLNKMPIPSQN